MILAATPILGSIPTCPTRVRSKRTYRSYCYEAKLSRVSDLKASEAISITNEGRRRCECFDLYKEIVPYSEAWSWQKSIVRERQALMQRNEDCSDTLIILQHPPVYTLGTGSSEEYLNFDIKDAPYSVYHTERGGEVTYHGPGQLVMYPVINLRYHKMDLHWYLRALEEVVIRVLSSTFSIKASRFEGFTGVWVGDKKLAAIGIRVSQWITYHGLALNVTTDLTPFQHIVPCGIRNRQVGSIEGLLGEPGYSNESVRKDALCIDSCQLMDITHKSLLKEFSEVFELTLHHKPISDLKFTKEEPSSLLTGKHARCSNLRLFDKVKFGPFQGSSQELLDVALGHVKRRDLDLKLLEAGVKFPCSRSPFRPRTFAFNKLIYCQMGSIGSVHRAFEEIPERNLALVENGNGEAALGIFTKMKREGVKPDGFTFTGVLMACGRKRSYFESMTKDYGIAPSMEYYANIVHLLGRSGKITEAKKFITKMPMEPSSQVWVTLPKYSRTGLKERLAELGPPSSPLTVIRRG
ncbi:hypothetical protein HHK36_010038 [Tetracentron sinense]|uniref:lipoyl(octanoyl) transferase n=1 Tax=Tetracentron sinense TaxID=13715 RepID=A0A834ZDP4_TETSI|nr:hypothetical protein HHK36_010038 [Tetracentron sinense]